MRPLLVFSPFECVLFGKPAGRSCRRAALHALVVKSRGAANLLRVPRSSAPRFRERAQGCDDEEANQTRGEVDQHERGEEVDAQEHPEIGIARCSNHVSTLMRRRFDA